MVFFFFSSRRRHTRCALVTGVQTCALPISGVVAMAPPLRLFDLESDGELAQSVKARFLDACRAALERGAEVIIPGDGVLNEFLFRHALLSVDGAVEIGRASCRERVCQYV